MEVIYEKFKERLIEYRRIQNCSQQEIIHTAIVQAESTPKSHSGKPRRSDGAVSGDVLLKMYETGINVDFLITGIEREDTELNELIEGCPVNDIVDFLRTLANLMDIAVRRMDDSDGKAAAVRELEVLKYNLEAYHSGEGNKWNCVRNAYGLTQEQTAELLNTGVKEYRDIEKGSAKPDAKILSIMYDRLGYSPSLMLDVRERDYIFVLNGIWEKMYDEEKWKIKDMMEEVLEKCCEA